MPHPALQFYAHHFSALSIAPTLNLATVKSAYKTKALQLHPDKSRIDDTAAAFRAVQEAWEVLQNVLPKLAGSIEQEALEAEEGELEECRNREKSRPGSYAWAVAAAAAEAADADEGRAPRRQGGGVFAFRRGGTATARAAGAESMSVGDAKGDGMAKSGVADSEWRKKLAQWRVKRRNEYTGGSWVNAVGTQVHDEDEEEWQEEETWE